MRKEREKVDLDSVPWYFTCGTRRIVRGYTATGRHDGTYRVVCATCGAGGTVPHALRESAAKACVRDSIRACRSCGAS